MPGSARDQDFCRLGQAVSNS